MGVSFILSKGCSFALRSNGSSSGFPFRLLISEKTKNRHEFTFDLTREHRRTEWNLIIFILAENTLW